MAQGISNGYMRPADGIVKMGTGPGTDRGGINWNNVVYRVMGTKLVSVAADGSVSILGEVGAGGQVSLDYSFDRLAIASGGKLFYLKNGIITQVTDPDLGTVNDMLWVDGYFMTTDGVNIVVTELNDPMAVNPLKYGSSEADPDPIIALKKLRNEIYALNRYTIEVFDNVGGDLFPFARVSGALIPYGCVGTHACTIYAGSIAFIGSARNEAVSVYLMAPGTAIEISTREIDQILQGYSEQVLSNIIMETKVYKSQNLLYIHLPDQTLVYDLAASKAASNPIWFTLATSIVGNGTYRARGLVWCYGKWIAGDPLSSNIGQLVENISTHYDLVIGWEFGTQILYLNGNGAIIYEMELVCMPGRVILGADPVVWTSYSVDGEVWSMEKSVKVGKIGDRTKRVAWRNQGNMQSWRVQKFRGTSDAHLSIVRLEIAIEPLFTRPKNG